MQDPMELNVMTHNSEGSTSGAPAITRIDHMKEVYDRIRRLQVEQDHGVSIGEQGRCKILPATKPPLAAAAEAVASVTPDNVYMLKDGAPARFRLSFRFVVMTSIMGSVLFSCLGVFLPFRIVTMKVHDQVLSTLSQSVTQQQGLIRKLVLANVTQSYEDIVVTMEHMVQHCIKAPAVNFVKEEWNTMRSHNLFYEGWGGGVTAHDLTISRHRSWMGFVDRVNSSCRWGFDTPTKWDQQTIRGSYAAQLLVGFSTGEYSSMALRHRHEDVEMYVEDGAPDQPGQLTNVTRWRLDFETGHKLEPPTDSYSTSFHAKPWYSVQSTFAQQAHLAGHSSSRVRTAWSEVHDLAAGLGLGLAWTQPIAYCGNYSCFSGVIAFSVALSYLDAACEDRFKSLQTMVLHRYDSSIGRDNSSVFIVNHKSRKGLQRGLLMGVSDGSNVSSGSLRPAEESEQDIVRSVASALKHKLGGSWDLPEVHGSHRFFNFKRRHWDASGILIECDDWASSALKDDCQRVASVSVVLDEETSWLVVATLPAGVFTRDMALVTNEVSTRVSQSSMDVEGLLHQATVWAVVAFLLVLGFSCVLSLGLGWFITRPLQQLAGLMRRLGDLDFASDAHELARLRSGRHSWVKEVGKLQKAFCRLSRGIEVFARFVPEPVVRNIVRGESWASRLHVTNRIVTIMFSDIRDFTAISEKLSQCDLLFVVTRYLSVMTRIVEFYSGVVSEVQGDGLLVLWNTPEDMADHAAMACAAALAQQQALRLLNRDFERQGLPTLAVRIGLNTGEVMTGNLGSFTKMRFGCLGDPINLASRLEGLCKFYGVGIICSGATHELLPEGGFVCRKLDLVQVKGRKKPTWIYEVVGSQCWLPQASGNNETTTDMETGSPVPSTFEPLEVARQAVNATGGVSRDKIQWCWPWTHLKSLRAVTGRSQGTSALSDTEQYSSPGPVAAGFTPRDASPSTAVSPSVPATYQHGGGCPEGGSCAAADCTTAEVSDRIRLYEQALLAFQKAQFVEVVRLLDDFLHNVPNDLAAQGLRERACRYLSADGKRVSGLSLEELSSWTGVHVMTDK